MSAPRLLEMPAFSEFIARMTARGAAPAVISRAGELSYAELLRASDRWIDRLQEHGVGAGTVCGYVGEFSPATIALFIALMRRRGAPGGPPPKDGGPLHPPFEKNPS